MNRIAGAPISWGVCEVPGWGYQLRSVARRTRDGESLTQLVTVNIAILFVSGALRSIGFTAYKPTLPSPMSLPRS
jgi:hypothetical protein